MNTPSLLSFNYFFRKISFYVFQTNYDVSRLEMCVFLCCRGLMPKALDSQIVMEKTPRYFVTVETPARVHAMSQDVKLIVVVRDPVTRAISDYTQIISKTPDIPPFESLAFRNRSSGTGAA